MQRLDEFDRFFFHVHDQSIHPGSVIAVADQSRNRDRQASCGRYQRLSDAAGESGGIANAKRCYLGKDLHHTNDGTQEAE